MKPIPVKKRKLKLAARLEEHVRALTDLGERSTRCPEALEAAAVFIETRLQSLGYSPVRQTFEADGISCSNIEAPMIEFRTDRPHLLVGAHYDSAEGTPGADDNASAVAILLELAERFSKTPELPVRFVAFVNEEPPYFDTKQMGSRRFAARADKNAENILGMVCLESLGIFISEPASQLLPETSSKTLHLMPESVDMSIGNFVAVIGTNASFDFCQSFAAYMRCGMRGVPLLYGSMPDMEVSDHLAFWRRGIPAVMVTDTAMLRNRHYHEPTDTPEKLNYPVMTEVLRGIERAIRAMAEKITRERRVFSTADIDASREIVRSILDTRRGRKNKIPACRAAADFGKSRALTSRKTRWEQCGGLTAA